MRLIIAFAIILAFPLILRTAEKPATAQKFCVPKLGFCLYYDETVMADAVSLPDQNGARLPALAAGIEGELTARVDALQTRFEQMYITYISDLESTYGTTVDELKSVITDDYFYVEVEVEEQRLYLQCWRKGDRLVQVKLQAPRSVNEDSWILATRELQVVFR